MARVQKSQRPQAGMVIDPLRDKGAVGDPAGPCLGKTREGARGVMGGKQGRAKKTMPFFQSLFGKYLGVAGAVLFLLASLTAATFFLTSHIQGEAQRINLAGRQRMLLFHLAIHAHFLTANAETPEAIDLHLREIRDKISTYEQTLQRLQGDRTGYSFAPPWFVGDHQDIEKRLRDLTGLWEKEQKPLLLQIMDNPVRLAKVNEQLCTDCHTAFVSTFDQVDGFVSVLARHNDRILKEFNLLRLAILVVSTLALTGIVLFVKEKMLKPVMVLQGAAAAMEQGDFPGRLIPRTRDEIGLLTETFNRMAVALSANIREMEEQVQQRTEELQKSNKELERFVYTVSHDLRAPLRAIEGFTAAIREDGGQLPPELQGHLNQIMAAIAYMETMIADLLHYSRIAFQEIEPEPVETGVLFDHVVHELSAEIEKTAARITVEEPLPAVMGHQNTLVQILINLVSNSLKFIKSGTRPVIRIWGERKGAALRLLIADNGIGIESADQERIFHVFVRLHGNETYPGTGIGLASVRRGLERLGGTCGVVSIPGQGSTFWIELPLAPGDDKSISDPHTRGSEEQG